MRMQLEDLLHLVGYSHLHFVRCIKPNHAKLKSFWERELVHHQLLCSGIFEAVRVVGMGYPDRLPHFQVYHPHILRAFLLETIAVI